MSGGTGKTFDWSIARDAIEKTNREIIIAGGLNSTNVEHVVKAINPFGVDVSSGVESAPGTKDMTKLDRFVREVKVLDLDLQELEGPDVRGHFGPYGGVYVGETLIAAVEELNSVYQTLSESDTFFWSEFHHELNHYVGRPSPLYFADRLTQHCGGAKST